MFGCRLAWSGEFELYQPSTPALIPNDLLQLVGHVPPCVLNVLGVFFHPPGTWLYSGRSKCIMVCFFVQLYSHFTELPSRSLKVWSTLSVFLVELWLKIPCFQALGSTQVRGHPADMSEEILNIPPVRYS
jgi:hypothetical protein